MRSLLFSALLILATPVMAQTIFYEPQGSLETFSVKAAAQDTVTVQICIKRMDVTPPVVVGCADSVGEGLTTMIPIVETVTVDDAPEWRAFAYSSNDPAIALESTPSVQEGTTRSFFRPAPPTIQP